MELTMLIIYASLAIGVSFLCSLLEAVLLSMSYSHVSILEKGGSVDAMELYKNFRGHEPDVEPLLKRAGLV